MSMYSSGFFVNDTATTEIYTYCTLFPYTTLFRSLLEARPAVALERGAVGLIETGLEHEGQVELGGNLLQVARRLQRQARVLQHVQPEDAEERLAPADRQVPLAEGERHEGDPLGRKRKGGCFLTFRPGRRKRP